METQRGIGVAGALDHSIVRSLATEAERLGYATFWANDTPQGDGLASLAAAASTTGTIRLGVGVIAVDRIPADVIVSRVAELGLPVDRLLVGIGAGRTRVGSLDLIERSAAVLRAAGIASAVGALGPRMVNLTGRVADAALFNWLTPNAATESSAALALAAGDRAVEPINACTGRLRPGFAGTVVEEAGRCKPFRLHRSLQTHGSSGRRNVRHRRIARGNSDRSGGIRRLGS
ncbi:MAG: LLM class flavin-dependent oxidoreductase [Thermomicrobiales bacterium]